MKKALFVILGLFATGAAYLFLSLGHLGSDGLQTQTCLLPLQEQVKQAEAIFEVSLGNSLPSSDGTCEYPMVINNALLGNPSEVPNTINVKDDLQLASAVREQSSRSCTLGNKNFLLFTKNHVVSEFFQKGILTCRRSYLRPAEEKKDVLKYIP